MKKTALSSPEIKLELVPASTTDTLSRLLSEAVRRSFNDPQVREQYRKWKKARQEAKA